jgi:hypothetical protein
MKNKHTYISILVLLVVIGGAFYLYNPNLGKNFSISQKEVTVKGTIQSLKMGLDKNRKDGQPGIQIEIALKPDGGGGDIKMLANSDTFYKKFVVNSDDTYTEELFRIEEMKIGDKVEVVLSEKTSFGRRVNKLTQYVY